MNIDHLPFYCNAMAFLQDAPRQIQRESRNSGFCSVGWGCLDRLEDESLTNSGPAVLDCILNVLHSKFGLKVQGVQKM